MVGRSHLIGPEDSFDPGFIADIRRKRGIGGSVNLEKALWALEYTNQLSETGLDFVLKGGTAVQLVTDPSWPRFSIDVDICTDASTQELEGVLSSIDDRFEKGFEFELRKSMTMSDDQFSSYRVTTPPIGGPSRTILLDVYLSVPDFSTKPTPVRSFFYPSDKVVNTPTVGSLVGDKLTIVAPSTIGRRLRDSRQGVEYSKHVFDIHRLIMNEPNPDEIKDTFLMVVEEQSIIRDIEFQVEDVIEDVTQICQVIATLNLPPDWSGTAVPDLPLPLERMRQIFRKGVRNFRPFLAGDTVFGTDELVTAAGEAALIAMSCRSENAIGGALTSLGANGLWDRTTEISRTIIEGAAPEHTWFLDLQAGLYSRKALAIWSEVVRILNGP